MRFLNHALHLAKMGFRVFPCYPGAKNPAFPKPEPGEESLWQKFATTDALELTDKWAENQNYNPAIFTRDHVVIDADTYKGADLEALKALGPLPDTFTVRTARGGLHLYFKSVDNYSNSPGALPPHFDVRGHGGLVLGPGAVFEGREYTVINDVPPAPLPDWLALTLRRAAAKTGSSVVTLGETDTPEILARAQKYIETSAPEAVEGRRNTTAYIVSNKLLDFGVSPQTLPEPMAEWNETKCLPPLEDEELLTVCRSASTSRRDAIGCDNPIVGLAPIDRPGNNGLLEFPSELSRVDLLQQSDVALVKGILGPDQDAVLYGPSTVGKTFIALDLGFALTHGVPWAGRRVNRSAVLYVGLEGAGGIRKRILAAREKYGDSGRHFARLKLPVSLVRSDLGKEGVATIVRAFNALLTTSGAATGLIIIDTLSRAIAGDNENDAADMAAFIEKRMGAIRRQASGSPALLIVHHPNKDGGLRGSGTLTCNMDLVLRADFDEQTQQRSLHAEKVKDGETGKLFDYRLKPINFGDDSDGDPVTTCTIEALPGAKAIRAAACDKLVREILEPKIRSGRKFFTDLHTPRDPGTGEERCAAKYLLGNGGSESGYLRAELKSASERVFSEIEDPTNGTRYLVMRGSDPASSRLPPVQLSSDAVPKRTAKKRKNMRNQMLTRRGQFASKSSLSTNRKRMLNQ